MKNIFLTTIAFVICIFSLHATSERELSEVVVTGVRPLKDIGVQQTSFDSIALKENIALSMADVLTFNSPLFVKDYGRATLATVSFRGTSPNHTKVTWNGMQVNSPMSGMTDFSIIPAYFVDRASLLHGASSVMEVGGGLGGLVRLSTNPDLPNGFSLRYIQGVGSFSTFDEFLHLGFSNEKWKVSTRAVCMTSPNDFTFVNHDKMENVYDSEHNIVDRYHPKEKNRSGAYRDIHVLQEVFYTTRNAGKIGINAWYVDSDRELPMLTTDYGDEREFENKQKEHTFRGVFSWDIAKNLWKLGIKGGYTFSRLIYDYKREVAPGKWAVMTESRNSNNTFFASGEFEITPLKNLSVGASINIYQYLVKSVDGNVIKINGDKAIIGYDKGRFEMSGSASVRWQPIERIGLGATLREELNGMAWSPLIPAFFVDGLLTTDGKLIAKASLTRNYRVPTLNDLFFLPGGNPDLKNEKGISYDTGLSYRTGFCEIIVLNVEGSWFDSYIDDWIIWLPTTKGYFSPRNVKRVHAYGVEARGNIGINLPRNWHIELDGSYSHTPSINKGDKMSNADKSVGKQLPYIPRNSASVTGRLSWRDWSFLYKWCWYSERFTMSSNEFTLTGRLPQYFMSNVSLEKNFALKVVDLQLKLAVNNLFDEDYQSVLGRPMPGINFEFFIGIVPKFKWNK